MKKSLVGVVVTLFAAFALAQEANPIAPQFVGLEQTLKAVEKLIDHKDHKLSANQAALLLPYLREVRANSALSAADAEFYTSAIRRLLNEKQLEVAGLKPKAGEAPVAAGGSTDQGLAGGGEGTAAAGSGLAALTIASNPFLQGERVKSLDDSILRLMTRAEPAQ